MVVSNAKAERVFKTAWFAKKARKAGISDSDLCEAVREVMVGQADDLGGGVFKKRLGKNMYRGIILAKGGRYWFYQYVFAKKDRDNIRDDELMAFRTLAKSYAALTDDHLDQLLNERDLMEICDVGEV